ncbi:hypothetical protein AB205_0036820 [Aquarana catesbeiana]|uniref:Uncharacterized protein n=1 Tax=Aquarana catesbeiana TaxID=8400 RepID=A0A2G9QLW3_AQUCT|nr:hypothetical protein AB205_0036820 [Aquarana catesbeiana]
MMYLQRRKNLKGIAVCQKVQWLNRLIPINSLQGGKRRRRRREIEQRVLTSLMRLDHPRENIQRAAQTTTPPIQSKGKCILNLLIQSLPETFWTVKRFLQKKKRIQATRKTHLL